VYEEMVRVPLILWTEDGSLPAGKVVPGPVSLIDVLPTLRELFELGEPEHEVHGQSLLPGAARPSAAPDGRPIFLSSRYQEERTRLHYAVRSGDWKLLSHGGRFELFDLSRDPGEQVDRSAEQPAHARALRRLLSRWYDRASEERPRPVPASLPSQRIQDELRNLGYIGDEED